MVRLSHPVKKSASAVLRTTHLLLLLGLLLLWRQQRLPSELVLELGKRIDAVNVEEIGEIGALGRWFGWGMRSWSLESVQQGHRGHVLEGDVESLTGDPKSMVVML